MRSLPAATGEPWDPSVLVLFWDGVLLVTILFFSFFFPPFLSFFSWGEREREREFETEFNSRLEFSNSKARIFEIVQFQLRYVSSINRVVELNIGRRKKEVEFIRLDLFIRFFDK